LKARQAAVADRLISGNISDYHPPSPSTTTRSKKYVWMNSMFMIVKNAEIILLKSQGFHIAAVNDYPLVKLRISVDLLNNMQSSLYHDEIS